MNKIPIPHNALILLTAMYPAGINIVIHNMVLVCFSLASILWAKIALTPTVRFNIVQNIPKSVTGSATISKYGWTNHAMVRVEAPITEEKIIFHFNSL